MVSNQKGLENVVEVQVQVQVEGVYQSVKKTG